MSNWLNFSVKVRKMLILIMERAKRPLIITAGKYFILNLATLMAVSIFINLFAQAWY